MILAASDFGLGDLLVAMFAFSFIFMYVWMFIGVFSDIFRRPDLSGAAKAAWTLLIFILPLVGILIYLVVRPPVTEVPRA